MRNILILLTLLCLTGCEDTKSVRQPTVVESMGLPSSAKIIEDIGNDWFVVEIEVNNIHTKFLFKREKFHVGHGNIMYTTVLTKLEEVK